ncbi:Scr1 family TA system antitoxin-like transcriptional regulator [Streptomyces sp. NPDC097619]|uniref:Scr1 family TA system antitoxin-like transcriptional regulator n=1 Tax=Streptomyces sp. NPDC097619 TaxID=3157228 RepID=UPI003319473B
MTQTEAGTAVRRTAMNYVLGAYLRNARTKAEMTLLDVSERIDKDVATVSRWECGKTHPKPADVHAFLTACRKRGRTVRDRHEFKVLTGPSYRDDLFIDVMGEAFEINDRLTAVESNAKKIIIVSDSLLPPNLQTADYSTIAHENGACLPQRPLPKAPVVLYMAESFLTNRWPGYPVLAEQLRYLVELIHAGRLTLHLYPDDTMLPRPTTQELHMGEGDRLVVEEVHGASVAYRLPPYAPAFGARYLVNDCADSADHSLSHLKSVAQRFTIVAKAEARTS